MNKKLKQIPILSLLLFTPFLAFCQIPEKRETNKLAINDIPESNIYWLGESHGTRKNYDLAYQLYTYIDSAKHIDYFITECGFLQAHYLNQYIISGDTNKLNAAFTLNTGTFGWTKEHKSFYESIYQHEKTKSITDRIKFIDIDIEHGYWNTHRYLLDSLVPRRISDTTLVLSKINSAIKIGNEYNAYYNSLYNDMIKRESAYKSILNQNFETLKYIVRNICYIKLCQGQPDKDWDKLRDSLIYKNFSYKNSYLNFKDYKSFAFWGNDHVLQAETKTDVRFIASRIKRNNPEIMQTSFYTLYSDCHFNTPTFFLPGFIRWFYGRKPYFITKGMNNDKIWVKVNGTKLLKKKIENENDYIVNKIELLPDRFDFINGRKREVRNLDYIQYVILVRKSDACTPLGKIQRGR